MGARKSLRTLRRVGHAIVLGAALLAAGSCSDGDRGATESSRYQESPLLRERVEAGKLPPVEERLPDEPLVVEVPEVGTYGGTMGGGRVIQSDEWRPTR